MPQHIITNFDQGYDDLRLPLQDVYKISGIVTVPVGHVETGIIKPGIHNTLGVKQIIVSCNKMDNKTVNYDEGRYKEIKEEVGGYLKKVGYKPMKIPFDYISGCSIIYEYIINSNISV